MGSLIHPYPCRAVDRLVHESMTESKIVPVIENAIKKQQCIIIFKSDWVPIFVEFDLNGFSGLW